MTEFSVNMDPDEARAVVIAIGESRYEGASNDLKRKLDGLRVLSNGDRIPDELFFYEIGAVVVERLSSGTQR